MVSKVGLVGDQIQLNKLLFKFLSYHAPSVKFEIKIVVHSLSSTGKESIEDFFKEIKPMQSTQTSVRYSIKFINYRVR